MVTVKVLLIFYVKSLFTDTHSAYLDILLYIVIHYRLVVYLLNYFICHYTARMSCYRKVIYKFKYLKSQGFGIQDYYFLLIV